MPPTQRAKWSEQQLRRALESINSGMYVQTAAKRYNIPRRTLRNHVETGSFTKKLGRSSVLTEEQENELCQRIIRLANIGVPLTNKIIRKSVYTFANTRNIRHSFNREKEMAGRKWIKLFFARHPEITERKAQLLNPARAQKMNKTVVNDYFTKLKQIMIEKCFINKPHLIFNMDEKGCRLTLHHQQRVLARKGERRVHIIAPEHAENVTVVACGSAIGQAIPPMVLFKGKRCKDEWKEDMPPGTVIQMTPKGSMTKSVFCKWLQHFAKFKPEGDVLLIMDGAASHLDISVFETADALGITLFCLPSNTTHELQPLDKCVFRSFEHYWDEEVLLYWTTFPERKITRTRFGKILSNVYPKSVSAKNLQSAFEATGIFPYNPNAIPEIAFAPSRLSYRAFPAANNENTEKTNEDETDCVPMLNTSESEEGSASRDSDNEPLINLVLRKKKSVDSNRNKTMDAIKPNTKNESQDSSLNESKESIKEMFPTPEIKTPTTKRRKTINSAAQVIVRDLFSTPSTSFAIPATTEIATSSSSKNRDKNEISKIKNKRQTEIWYCFICKEDRMLDMRLCVLCCRYVHEECVGLDRGDKSKFVCHECECF